MSSKIPVRVFLFHSKYNSYYSNDIKKSCAFLIDFGIKSFREIMRTRLFDGIPLDIRNWTQDY